MFFGFFELGATVFGLVMSQNASGISTAPDATPTFRAYGGSSTTLATGTCAAFDALNLNYVYSFSFTASGGFARGGNYQLVVSYEIGSQPKEVTYSFSIY